MYICGSCAKSQETTLSAPNAEEMKASGVGIQESRQEDTKARKGLDGSQCSGRLYPASANDGNGGGIVH